MTWGDKKSISKSVYELAKMINRFEKKDVNEATFFLGMLEAINIISGGLYTGSIDKITISDGVNRYQIQDNKIIRKEK